MLTRGADDLDEGRTGFETERLRVLGRIAIRSESTGSPCHAVSGTPSVRTDLTQPDRRPGP